MAPHAYDLPKHLKPTTGLSLALDVLDHLHSSWTMRSTMLHCLYDTASNQEVMSRKIRLSCTTREVHLGSLGTGLRGRRQFDFLPGRKPRRPMNLHREKSTLMYICNQYWTARQLRVPPPPAQCATGPTVVFRSSYRKFSDCCHCRQPKL